MSRKGGRVGRADQLSVRRFDAMLRPVQHLFTRAHGRHQRHGDIKNNF